MPAEEKAYWHDHKYEVDAGLLKSLTQTGAEEKATLAKVRTLYGKIFHTWSTGKTYPQGPARLFWAVTGEEPFVLPATRNTALEADWPVASPEMSEAMACVGPQDSRVDACLADEIKSKMKSTIQKYD